VLKSPPPRSALIPIITSQSRRFAPALSSSSASQCFLPMGLLHFCCCCSVELRHLCGTAQLILQLCVLVWAALIHTLQIKTCFFFLVLLISTLDKHPFKYENKYDIRILKDYIISSKVLYRLSHHDF